MIGISDLIPLLVFMGIVMGIWAVLTMISNRNSRALDRLQRFSRPQSLAEILDKIGYVIRERFRILGQVKALTAEGRLSGVILIALPFGLFLMMLHIKPDYVEKLWTHELGIKMSVFALFMQLLGAIVIRKIVNIKV